MKKFLDDDFCLNNETGKKLYHAYAKDLPIIDYHCHLDPKDIAEDRVFSSLSELWLSGDHYKWRLLRADGAEEAFVTGEGDDSEKIRIFAKALEKAIGNPLYHWCHMELKKYFDYNGVFNFKNADNVIEHCKKYFENGEISARKLIEKSNVTHICTTDDPVSDLKYHEILSKDESFKVKVFPSWRPDKALNIEKDGFLNYVEELSNAAGVSIKTFDDLKTALKKRMEFFEKMGCRTADHGLEKAFYENCSDLEADEIFKNALSGKKIEQKAAEKFKSKLLLFMAESYVKYDWVMQLHYGCDRNVNTKLFNLLGADTGIDCTNPREPSGELARLINSFCENNTFPKTVVYSLDPTENAAIDTIIGCFSGKKKGHIQHGAAWWFNDHKKGIEEHLDCLAAGGILGNFIGMLTDSRSFVSYTRHDYFRRILCNRLGLWVEMGEYPFDEEVLESIVKNVCYYNSKEYFNL